MRLIDISTPKYPDTFARVDDADFAELSRFKWYAMWADGLYVVRNLPKGSSHTSIKMHQQVMGVRRRRIDHIDGDGLNNQRANLRLCTNAQNCWNSKSRGGSSRFKGVAWHKGTARWAAKIMCKGRSVWLGVFESEESAARAYDAAALRLFGRFARLNFEFVDD